VNVVSDTTVAFVKSPMSRENSPLGCKGSNKLYKEHISLHELYVSAYFIFINEHCKIAYLFITSHL
jgi:hypothetical protein